MRSSENLITAFYNSLSENIYNTLFRAAVYFTDFSIVIINMLNDLIGGKNFMLVMKFLISFNQLKVCNATFWVATERRSTIIYRYSVSCSDDSRLCLNFC